MSEGQHIYCSECGSELEITKREMYAGVHHVHIKPCKCRKEGGQPMIEEFRTDVLRLGITTTWEGRENAHKNQDG